MIKIWGTSFSLIGDLIMSLPQLNYYKNKYQDIYVNFVIHKKIAYCAPLFFNHPLIDKILISEEWSSFGDNDYKLACSCDYVTVKLDYKNKKILDRNHQTKDWYNYHSCIDECAFMSNIKDLDKFINKNEKFPKLYKWFDVGFDNLQKKGAYTYDKQESKENNILRNSISIWPFAGYGRSKNRNPEPDWWKKLVNKFVQNKVHVYHFGYINEPILSINTKYYHNLTKLDFFSQIKISLGSKLALGTDSGSMWVLAAYSHPSIILLTNWYENHNKNFNSLLPPNVNGDFIFKENGFKYLTTDEVYEKCISHGVSEVRFVNKLLNFF
jgi:ADP-heptose:LPS heptosyltransferase